MSTQQNESDLTIGKLDAARRQLETALTLWFNEGDPVSVHTLACAAYEVIHTVSEKRNPYRRDLLFDSFVVKDEYRREFNRLIRGLANFFKHADRDPDAVITFKPILTELFFMFSVLGVRLCGESLNEAERSFSTWVKVFKPHFLTDNGRKILADRIPANDLRQLQTLTKSEFFQVLKLAARQGNNAIGRQRFLIPVPD